MASTVLPNGTIIPEKYSRDWYNDLYHNWQELDNLLGGGTPKDGTLTIQKNGTTVGTFSANQATDETVNIEVPTKTSDLTNDSGFITSDNTKIPLAGSNAISGSLIPSTDGTVDLGSSSYQWNNAYIKSLTINGVACGDILTHNASEFVDVSSNQTIGGDKTFSGNVIFNPYGVKIKHSSQEIGVVPSANLRNGIDFIDKNNSSTFSIGQAFLSDGNTTIHFSMTPNIVGGSPFRIFESTYNASANKIETKLRTLIPDANSLRDLGTSTNKWKSFNGLNPGALSLPGSYVNADTTNWVLDGSNANSFTPTSDGWLGIQAIDTVYDQMHYVFVGRIGGGNAYYQQNVLSPINALWGGEYHGCVFIPVIKNVGYGIRCICSSIKATFYPCKGNV